MAFSDEVLEKIFANKEMQTIPVGCQSTAIHVIEDVLEEMGVDLDVSESNVSKSVSE